MSSPLHFDVLTDKQYRPMEGDFIIRLALRMSVSDMAETLPLNLCLLIDCSYSMKGEKMDKAREAAKSLVEHLREDDLLTVITFSSDADILIDKMKMSPSKKSNAVSVIDAVRHSGVTRMDLGLDAAYHTFMESKDDFMPVLLLLSDGAPTDKNGNLLDDMEHDTLYQAISAAFKENGITTSTVGLGDASQCLAPFLEACGEKGGGVFYHARNAQDLVDQFMEELNRVKATAISDVKFVLSDVLGKIRKAAAVHPDVRGLDAPGVVGDRFELEGGSLQKGEDHAFLVEIVTPSFPGDNEKRILCQVKAEYRLEGEEREDEVMPVIIEYTNDENLIQKAAHPEVEKYKDMYKVFIQTQKAAENIRAGADPKKTQALIQSAAKTTKKLGLSKQTKQLEELSSKVEDRSVTEDDITKTSVSSRKTKVLGK